MGLGRSARGSRRRKACTAHLCGIRDVLGRPSQAEVLPGQASRFRGGTNLRVLNSTHSLHLSWSAATEKGYSCPLRLTFRQALELGGNVSKGETGKLVVYANRITRTETDDKDDKTQREIPFLKCFNAE